VLRIAASRGFLEFTENWIRSSHGHSKPSLKISCKSVQPFSLANKETKKSIANNTPFPMYRGRGNNCRSSQIPYYPESDYPKKNFLLRRIRYGQWDIHVPLGYAIGLALGIYRWIVRPFVFHWRRNNCCQYRDVRRDQSTNFCIYINTRRTQSAWPVHMLM